MSGLQDVAAEGNTRLFCQAPKQVPDLHGQGLEEVELLQDCVVQLFQVHGNAAVLENFHQEGVREIAAKTGQDCIPLIAASEPLGATQVEVGDMRLQSNVLD